MSMPEKDVTLHSLEAARAERQAAELMRLVGTRVHDARKALGWSRRELSERSGVSPRYLAQLEGGDGNISIGLLDRVARALHQPLDRLLRHGGPAGEHVRLSHLYDAASEATKARVWQMLDPGNQAAGKAQRLCLIGLRGAGKSTLGARLGAAAGIRFIELNREIEERAGIPLAEIIALYGEEGYRQLEADTLEDIIATGDRLVLAVAGGIVSQPETFQRVLSRFHTVWIKASPEDHMNRVRAQGDLRPMAGNPQAMAQLHQILKNREADYRKADHMIDTSGRSVEETLSGLIGWIREIGMVSEPDQTAGER